MAIHSVKKQARWPHFFIAFLKCCKHNYQLDQVLENFKYSFYFDGITLRGGEGDRVVVCLEYCAWDKNRFFINGVPKIED